jgi:hypothetical protein
MTDAHGGLRPGVIWTLSADFWLPDLTPAAVSILARAHQSGKRLTVPPELNYA